MANRAVVTWVAFETPAVPGAVSVVPELLTATLTLHVPTVTAERYATVTPSLLTLTMTLRSPVWPGDGTARRRGRWASQTLARILR